MFRRVEPIEARFLPAGSHEGITTKDGPAVADGPCWIRTDKCGEWTVDVDWFYENHEPDWDDEVAVCEWLRAYPEDGLP